ncbi:peptidylprolyl isomerase [Flavobacteriaceae bacterium]|nr:peptidylprolyl isomerase [Flavobacteriaceae bacterium]
MKKIILVCALLSFVFTAQSQSQKDVILTIENTPVYKQEFLRVYKKNLNLVKDASQKSVDGYLELFVDYKLKVQEAYAQKLDQGKAYKKEFEKYRAQLSRNYLFEQKIEQDMALEAYERSKEQINAQHVLIMVDYDALPQDTLVAYNKATEVMKMAKNGADFTDLVLQYSEEPNTKEQKGNLGYFSAFSMLYAFENAAYNTKVGAISDITRTSYGYHVIKVLDRRPTGNEITVSHIMVSNKNDDPTFDPQERINELYQLLNQGQKFEDLAKQFSENVEGFESSYPFAGYEPEDIPITGKLDYRIFFRSNAASATLTKPIIIIDGFDPGDKRKILDADTNQDPDKHRSINEMMEYIDDNGNPRKLIEELNTKGYDVVIVNHPIYTSSEGIEIDGGADYIERNALTHVTLYQHINQLLEQNNSEQQLIIVGPSMGGQISRYALAYMEANNIEHNTRLWVSIDSPHLGANIPIGLQTLVRQVMSDNALAQDFVNNHLGSAAAKQQLIEQLGGWNTSNVHQELLNGRTISQGFSQTRGHPFYIQYYDNLFTNGLTGSNGYPQNTRSVALVNGSLQGVKNFDSPSAQNVGSFVDDGQIALNVRAYQRICAPWPFQNNCWNIHVGSLESFTMPSFGENAKISRYKNFFDDDSKFVANNNSRGSMDNVAGGYFNGYNQLANPIEGTDPVGSGTIIGVISDVLGGAYIDINTNEQVHSFIPTISSLGFINPDFNWTQNLDRDLVCTNEIPFDNYYGPKNNQGHTSFTPTSVAWMFAELDQDPLPASVYNQEASLNGPSIICVNDIVTYDFDLCASTDVKQWQVSASLQIITSDEQSITVRSTNTNQTYNNQAWIKAIYEDHQINKELWIGKPDNPGAILGLEDVHFGSFNNYSVGPAQGAENYIWSLPEPFDTQNDVVPYIDGTSQSWQMNPTNTITNNNVFSGNAGYEGEMLVWAENSCGEGNYSWLEITQYNSGPCNTCLDPLEIVPYPNSANVSFKLDFREHGEGTFYIYIYDEFSNIMYQGSTSSVEKTVFTQDIPPGTYFLHIHTADEVTYQQLHISR